jgi:PKD repeat protein
MNKIATIFVLFSTGLIYAQDSVSVLFIGNSYVFVNDLPTMFSNLTTSLGDEVTFDSKTNGGFTFQSHLNDPLTFTKIHSKPWDFVVIQGQSQEPSFETSQVNINTLPPAVQIADSVYANSYCSQSLYFMTWGRQVGDPQWDSINTFDKMNGRIRNAYLRITDSAQASVAPVGVAWKYVRDNYPSINLYSTDGSHPSLEGTYLAACTFYASVFRKTPVGASYTAGLDLVTVNALQTAAALCVLDSLDTWHLRAKEDISIANFQYEITGNSVQFINSSWRSTDFEWIFDDGSTSVDVYPIHNYAIGGVYDVQLIASSECGDDTLTIQLEIDQLSLTDINQFQYKKKTIESGLFEICGFQNTKIMNVVICDISGKELKLNNEELNDSETDLLKIDLRNYLNGVYFLKITTDVGELVIDLQVSDL